MPEFDPNKPFTTVSDAPEFDPNQPFTAAEEPYQSPLPVSQNQVSGVPVDPETGEPMWSGPSQTQQTLDQYGRTEATAAGRIGGAFTQPFKDMQWGIPKSFSDKFQAEGGPLTAFNAFNDLMINGVASPVFATLQAMGASADGAIDAMAQSAIESGADPDQAYRGARDVKGLLEVLPATIAPNAFGRVRSLAPGQELQAASRAENVVPDVSAKPNNLVVVKSQGTQNRNMADPITVVRSTKETATPEELAIVAEAQGLKKPVPLTKGDITQDPDIQAFETEAFKKVRGEKAYTMMQNARQEQDAAIRGNIEELQKSATGRMAAATPEETGLAAQRAAEAVKVQAARDKAKIDAAYDKARSMDAYIDGGLLKEFSSNSKARLVDKGFDVEIMDRVNRRLSDLSGVTENGGLNQITVGRIELLRKRINNDIDSTKISDASQANALRTLKSDLDDYVSELLDQDLIRGNTQAVDAWKSARDLRRDFGQKFETDKVVSRIVNEDLTQEEAVNLLFGGSQMGFKTQSGRTIKELKSILGEDSDAFRALKEEAILRLVKNQARTDEGLFSGVKFDTALQKAMKENPTLMNNLFTKEELGDLHAIARVSKRITMKAPGAVNNSDSFTAYLRDRARKRVTQKIPFVGEIIEEVWSISDNAKDATKLQRNLEFEQAIANYRRDPQVISQPLRLITVPSATQGAAVMLPNEEKKQDGQ